MHYLMQHPGDSLIPSQESGTASTTEEKKSLPDIASARIFYKEVKDRLLNVNQWHSYAGKASAAFVLCDEVGNPVQRLPVKGDHFQIDIPGPGPVSGDGYDWVQVEAMEEVQTPEIEQITIRVRPATSPKNEKSDVAHFFSADATSNFLVQRDGNTITAAVLGRNEKANTEADTIVDKARNTAVATGAVTAFSKLQWSNLVRGLIGAE